MTIRFRNIDDMLDTLCPQNMGMYAIGFTSDKTGGDLLLDDVHDRAEEENTLAGMFDIPEHTSETLHNAICFGDGDTDEERLAWTVFDELANGLIDKVVAWCNEAGVHVYVKPDIIQLDLNDKRED